MPSFDAMVELATPVALFQNAKSMQRLKRGFSATHVSEITSMGGMEARDRSTLQGRPGHLQTLPSKPSNRPMSAQPRRHSVKEMSGVVVILVILGVLFSIPMIQDYRIKQKELKEGKKPFHSSNISVYREECAEEIFKAIAAKFCPTKFMQEYLVGIGSTAKPPQNEFSKSFHFEIPPIGCFTGLWLRYCPRNAIVNFGPGYGYTEVHSRFPTMELEFQSEFGYLIIDCVQFLQQVATGAVQFKEFSNHSLSRQAMNSVRHLAARIEIPKGNPEGRRTCIGKSLWTKYSWNVWHFSPSEIQQLSFIQDKQKRIESILSFLTEILSDLSSAIDETKTERRKYSADMRKRFPLSVPKGN